MDLNFAEENDRSTNSRRNTGSESMQHWKALSEKLALMKIAHDEELKNMSEEAADMSERITSLERDLEALQTKSGTDAAKARENGIESGKSKAFEKVSDLLDEGLSPKASERLTSHCEKSMEAEARRLKLKLERLKRRFKKSPTVELKKALVHTAVQLAGIGMKPACIARRQRVRRRDSQKPWAITVIILSLLAMAAIFLGLHEKTRSDGYRSIIIATVDDGLHGDGLMSPDLWRDMLTVYNDVYGTDY